MTKRILTMQDLSCVGQCSLTVALPVLSAYGVEACILPTAVLSNHTMFKSWSYLDLTEEIENIFNNWKNNQFKFDGFLLGYLGKITLMDIAERCFDEFSKEGAPIIIDPAFGDNGKLYGGFDEAYVTAYRKLLKRADIILPNITEASFLTGLEYRDKYDRAYVENMVKALKKITNGTVIITGIELDGKIGEVICHDECIEYTFLEKLPKSLHGTGDIFASVFGASYLCGKSLKESCNEGGKFVADCIRATADEHFYGVNFEEVLKNKMRG
jgi:pyridoxine kinase